MPRLLLLRHAKAERTPPGATDRERALTDKGWRQAAEIGRLLAEREEAVDLVLCSSSRRTRETWEGVRAALSCQPELRLLRSLYDSGDDYLRILRDEGGDAGAILVVAHNPFIHETALELVGDFEGDAARDLSARFPKGALAILDVAGSWSDLARRQARLIDFVTPLRQEAD